MSAAIQGIYIALFGRPADPGGLAYWAGVTKNGADLSEMLRVLPNLPEYTDRFAGQTPDQVITTVYQNLFGRAPDAEGLAFFKGQLTSGAQTLATIAVNIMQGAQGDDRADVQAKVDAAQLFTASLDTPAEIAAYTGDDAAALAKKFLDTVDKDKPATPESVEKASAAVLAGEDPTGGQAPNPGPTGPGGGNPNAGLIAAFNAATNGEAIETLIKENAATLDITFGLVGGRADAVGLGVVEVRTLFGNFKTLAEIQTAVSKHIAVEEGKRDALASLYSTNEVNTFKALVEGLDNGRAGIISYYEQRGGISPSSAAAERIDDLKDELYTLALRGLVADAAQNGWETVFAKFQDVKGTNNGSVVTLVNKLYEAHAASNEDVGILRALNLADDYGDILVAIKDPTHWEEFELALKGSAFPDGQGRETAVGMGVLEHITLYGPFIDKAAAEDVISLHIRTELNKASLLSAGRDQVGKDFSDALPGAIQLAHDDRQEIIARFSASVDADPDAQRQAEKLRNDDYTTVLSKIVTFVDSLEDGSAVEGYWDAFAAAFDPINNDFGGSIVKLIGVLAAAHGAVVNPVVE